MNRTIRPGILTLLFLLLWVPMAAAAAKTSYVVLPFQVNGPQGFQYLEKSVPQTLTSRLFWKDHVEPVSLDLASGQGPVADSAAASKALARYKADYVVWGTIGVVGQDCTLDVEVRDKAGKSWQYTSEAKANQLMTALKVVSDSINREVFGRTPEGLGQSGRSDPINQMSPDIVVNETTTQGVYLNPQFRYAGGSSETDDQLRSQALPYTSAGMEVCDADGDGKSEIFILTDHTLYAYSFAPGKLHQIAKFEFPKNDDCLSIRALPQSSGKMQLVVNMIDKDTNPKASILSFNNGTFKEEMRNIKYFLNVVKLPPSYMPTLIGQRAQGPRLFRGDVHEMNKSGGELVPGRRIELPSGGNVLNFSFMPAVPGEPGSEKLILLSSTERIQVYNLKGSRLAETEETYSGSAKGFEISNTIHGMHEDQVTLKDMFYMPMRMMPVDFEGDGKYEILLNRPQSTASKVFDRYRFFPQSEIHCMFWDGIGLNLQWKTRRIKGSVADYAVADADNNGIMDLIVCVNTHPGALGVQKRKTVIMIYPLDLSKTTDVAPMHISD